MPKAHNLILLIAVVFVACNYTIKIKDGSTAHERKQYDTAIPMLEKDFGRAKTRSEKGQLAYRIADSYRNTGRDEAALQWFAPGVPKQLWRRGAERAGIHLEKTGALPRSQRGV